jgi:hypothetical protein
MDWRLFNEEVYQVIYTGRVIIYTTPAVPGTGKNEWTYISRNLDAPIHDLSRTNLIAMFHSDTAFLNKIRSLPWTTSIEKWDKEKQRYQFINWLSPNRKRVVLFHFKRMAHLLSRLGYRLIIFS